MIRPLKMHDVMCETKVRERMMEEMQEEREEMIAHAIKKKQVLTCSYMNYRNQVEELSFTPSKVSEVQKQGIWFRGVELVDNQGEERLLNAQRMFELGLS